MLAYKKIYPKLENSMEKKNSRKGKQFNSHVQDYEHNNIHYIYKTSVTLIFKLNELKEEIWAKRIIVIEGATLRTQKK